jgi:formylglycine-generating enzyme required for sulfatase activity
MLRRWVVLYLIVPIYVVILMALAVVVERSVSRALATTILSLGIVLLGWVWFNLDGRPTIFTAGRDTNDSKVQRYLRWLIKDTEYHVMDGVGQVTRDRDPAIYDLFCDLSSYGINERRLSLSGFLSNTTVGDEPYAAFLLGPPGSGKSVTLRAILLSCANSSFLYGSFLGKLFHRRTPRSDERITSVHKRFGRFFDSTWLMPTVAFVPILVDLRINERIFEKYLDEGKKDFQKDLLEPILRNCGGLEFQQFQALLRTGRIALLCDGLDELKSQELRVSVIEFLKSVFAMGKPARNFFLVTCRLGSFDDLRDFKPRDFKEVTLETLLAEDKRRIVRKLLLSELPPKLSSTKELISTAIARPEVRRMRGHIGSRKELHKTLIDDLVEEIITRVPKGFPTWRPSDFPLSLRRMTTVLVPRQTRDLRLSWETGDERPHWKLEIGALSDSMGEYTKIIEQDLLEFLRRRKKFAEHNDYSEDQMLLFYGELVYNCETLPHTFTLDELRQFVMRKAKTTDLTEDQQVEAFKAPGILTEIGINGSKDRFTFRDDESASLVTALYMLDRDAADRIDNYINKGHKTKDTTLPIFMAFSRLRGEALTSFVRNSKYFSDPGILQAAVFGGVGTQPHGRLSKDEADAFLRRSILEVEKHGENERTLPLWLLIRHIVFNGWCSSGWAPQLLLAVLEKPSVPACNSAQIILILAELTHSHDERVRSEDVELQIRRWINCEDTLVRGCAALAMNYLQGDIPEFTVETEQLSTIVGGGTYEVGDELSNLNPLDQQYLRPFRLARFPVLNFQFERWKNGGGAKAKAGDAFKPVVGVSLADALAFAQAHCARLPTATEFEVAAAYSGSLQKRRVYPWGDQIMLAQYDVLFEGRKLREILGDREEALTIALKPALATPSGIFDLVSNVWQLTSDRPPKVLRDPEVLVFGATISANSPHHFRCFNRAPLAADRGHNGVGFRLAWDSQEDR